ncbi:MAG: N-acetyl-alpha-D-glucosaminyl L-malate synthase BshA [Gracilimonas sp.]|uniref:N-acetyl-alpha-D-glucosaminyl L-malate synthase BshA n=1 Tax=Gracilimonas TaxID=649462 RepID=UPI001B0BDFD5|nr:N-acetyl-alpha-D-glucosaminyl L-malate synthase BshA [Gracilimonas sp.]MBO6585142.1 N-acetyl-alpha-D-glucosaminyl L-malate synthase BshA [Gracilimonas sp.]MBO6615586.1 N-acetyl-alpha-D-glucosaminyl L-malate synthase BshA [Gracilimonas sp.]
MNIGIVCYPTFGGSGVVATELAKTLAKKGHNIHMMSYAKPARLDTFETGITYHEVSINSYPLFEYPPYDLALATQMVNLIEYQDLDLLHVHYALPHATSAYLAKQIMAEKARHVPVITTLHGTDITLVGSDPSYKHVVEFSIDKSDGVTAVSEYLKKETYERFNIKQDIKVIPNFIDLDRFKKSNKSHFKKAICPNDEKVIVHVSNFRKVKRVPEVITVFAKILESGIESKLLLVGDGPDRQKAEQQCRDLGICEHVRFLGKLEQVEDVLSIADLFLIPSGSETFGLAALEAMSCSVPVISSNIGGLPEVNIHGETGYLCDLDDVDCMAEYGVKILSDADLHARMAANARKQAERYNQDVVVEEYERFYEDVSAKLLHSV